MSLRNWLVGGIAVVALIGLGSSLLRNPLGFFIQLLVIGIIAIIIYFAVQYFMGKSQSNNQYRSFAKAAKFSNKRQRHIKKTSSQTMRKKPLRRRSTAHLTVIEGKKSKKKDRAIF